MPKLRSLYAGVLCWLVPTLASAQAATPLDHYEPTPAGDPFFAVPSPWARGAWKPRAGVALSYAHAPLVMTADVGGERKSIADIVAYQLVLHTQVNLNLIDRVKLDVDVPATVAQKGEALTLATRSAPAPSGAALNDIRLGLRGEIIRAPGASLALSASVWLPTGNAENYTSAGTTRFAPALIVGGQSSTVVWATTLGAHLQSENTSHKGLGGSDLFAGLGGAYQAGKALQIGVELFGSTVTTESIRAFSKNRSSLEALLGLHARTGAFVWGAALAAGVVPGIGTPNYRLIFSAAFAPEPPPEASIDNHPIEPVASPPPSRVVPTTPVVQRALPPQDTDGDGIPDVDDKCPSEKGVAQNDRERNGCQVLHFTAARSSAELDYRGCPTPVGLGDLLTESIPFDQKRDSLREEAWPILKKVAAVMKSHPEIVTLRIDGHTDDEGASEAANIALAKARANTVYQWLTHHGVPAKRLETRGFALYCPRADDPTAARQTNRRVEFRVKK